MCADQPPHWDEASDTHTGKPDHTKATRCERHVFHTRPNHAWASWAWPPKPQRPQSKEQRVEMIPGRPTLSAAHPLQRGRLPHCTKLEKQGLPSFGEHAFPQQAPPAALLLRHQRKPAIAHPRALSVQRTRNPSITRRRLGQQPTASLSTHFTITLPGPISRVKNW